MRRNLMEEVSLSELYQMRDEGMSNQEIADALDTSSETIRKYIGKQPIEVDGRRKGVNRSIIPAPEKKKKNEEPIIPACLAVKSKRVKLEGNIGSYEVNSEDEEISVTLKDGDGFVMIRKDQLADLINELTAIQRKINEVAVGFEMW